MNYWHSLRAIAVAIFIAHFSLSADAGAFKLRRNASPLLYDNPFVSGRGSYEGGTLLGETKQSQNNPLLQNSGEASELAWVESLIFGNLPELPISWTELNSNQAQGRLITVDPDSNWDYGYVMLKWGGGQNSSDHALFYFSSEDLLNIQLPNDLSHARLWIHSTEPLSQASVNVPEGLSTLPFLAVALSALVLVHRMRFRD